MDEEQNKYLVFEQIINCFDLDLDTILDNRKRAHEIITGVYFLIRDLKVVYVGQSVDVIARVGSHRTNRVKQFDEYYFIRCPEEYMNILEAHFIAKLSPAYNTSTPKNPVYKSKNLLKKALCCDMQTITRFIEKNQIQSHGKYYKLGEFIPLMVGVSI